MIFPFFNLQCCMFKKNGKAVTEYDGNIDGWRGGGDFIGSYITHYFYKRSICWGSWPQIVLKIFLAISLTAMRSQIDCLHYFWKLKILSPQLPCFSQWTDSFSQNKSLFHPKNNVKTTLQYNKFTCHEQHVHDVTILYYEHWTDKRKCFYA